MVKELEDDVWVMKCFRLFGATHKSFMLRLKINLLRANEHKLACFKNWQGGRKPGRRRSTGLQKK
jgi:hypothetical protein